VVVDAGTNRPAGIISTLDVAGVAADVATAQMH
jgi:hypothetical protein